MLTSGQLLLNACMLLLLLRLLLVLTCVLLLLLLLQLLVLLPASVNLYISICDAKALQGWLSFLEHALGMLIYMAVLL